MNLYSIKQFDDELQHLSNQEHLGNLAQQKLQNRKIYQQNQQHRMNKYICLAFLFLFVVNLAWVIIQSKSMEGFEAQLEELQKWSEMISGDIRLENYHSQNYYWFSVSTRDLILNSDLQSLYIRDRKHYQIDYQTHFRGILLTQLTHNIDYNGEIKVHLSPFESDPRKKQKVIRLLLEYEKSYYEKKYKISQYQNAQLPFCLIIPSYNNAKSDIYQRNLDSIFMQDYFNYRIVYIDDHSPDNTGQFVNQYIIDKKIPKQKIKVIINSKNKKAMQNIYEAINEHCNDGQIAGIIDGDDSLNGRQVLKLFNALYHQKKLAFLYSNFLKIVNNSEAQIGFGKQVNQQYFKSGKLRNSQNLVCSHFMTFFVDLFKMTKQQDYMYENGKYFDYAYDRAIITSLLQLSYPKNFYLTQMVYEYRGDTGINDASNDWYRVSDLIQARPAYKPLKNFDFINENEIIKKGQKLVQSQIE